MNSFENEYWGLELPERSEYLENRLAEVLVRSIAENGSTQWNIVLNGYKGISEMSDEEFYEKCFLNGIIKRSEEYYIYNKP